MPSRRTASWWCTVPSDVRAALAAYDLLAATVAGGKISNLQRRRAFAAPPATWRRVLSLEGGAERFRHCLRSSGLWAEAPGWLRDELEEQSATAIRHGLQVPHQLAEIASLASSLGIRVLALKGAARLLNGDMAGARSLADIDVLVAAADVPRLHRSMQETLGYRVSGDAYAHHAAGLSRGSALGVEIHWQLSDRPLALDTEIWRDAKPRQLGSHVMEIPSPTDLLIHTLEHAAVLNWETHYRLRDVLDVADTWSPEVSTGRVLAHARRSPQRGAFATLMSVAHRINARVPSPTRDAWRTVRRVARVRVAAAASVRDRLVAMRLFRYAGVVAEGSPRNLALVARHLAGRAVGLEV